MLSSWSTTIGLPTALLVTGDTAIRGNEHGMRAFADTVEPLVRAMKDEGRIACIVPGNHDVTWNLPDDLKRLSDEFVSFRHCLIDRLGVGSCLFPRAGRDGALEFEPPDHGPLLVDVPRKLVVLAINSAIRCGERNTTMLNRLQEQIETLAAPIGPAARDTILKWAEEKAVSDVAHVTEVQRRALRERMEQKRREIERSGTNVSA
jgi:hypothetical protein